MWSLPIYHASRAPEAAVDKACSAGVRRPLGGVLARRREDADGPHGRQAVLPGRPCRTGGATHSFSRPSASSAMPACAYAAPARISAATQIASMSSSGLAPLFWASSVWLRMQ